MKNYIIIGTVAVIIIVGTYFVYRSSPPEQLNIKQETELLTELQTSCLTKADCKEYVAYNTCELFCANNEEANNEVISKLKVTCDSTLWDRPIGGNCSCVKNTCQFVD